MSHYYVFVRTDIPLADQICQVSHASVLAGKRFQLPNNCNLVLLQVKDKEALLKVSDKLNKLEIQHVIHHEPDDDMQETCLASQVVPQDQRRFFSNYPLWKSDLVSMK